MYGKWEYRALGREVHKGVFGRKSHPIRKNPGFLLLVKLSKLNKAEQSFSRR